jgi:hypothetical protein
MRIGLERKTTMSDDQPAFLANQAAPGSGAPCHCAESPVSQTQYIYSIGKLEVRFPSLGIEREFQQRERQIMMDKESGWTNSGERLFEVLTANPHLARAICFVQLVGNIPAYVVVPSGLEVMRSLIGAVRGIGEPDLWSIVIGKRGPMATPATCGGLLAPMMACDQAYTFTTNEFVHDLLERVQPAISARGHKTEALEAASRDVFRRITGSMENLGAQDGHRALNYFLVQHPGLFVAIAERVNEAVLDTIETRVTQGGMGNRIVTIVLTFIRQATGVPERLFCRVDVTEEWPFVADVVHGGSPALGLQPFIETGSPAC